MKIAIYLLFASMASVPLTGQPDPSSPPLAVAAAAAPDLALRESLVTVQAMAQKTDADVGRLHIEKWKMDGQSKQQSQANAASIRRNLTNAVPELVQRVQNEPGSLAANFKLYRNLNALYDSFSALAESAGAFGPEEQYTPLAADLAQLDQLRRQFAERVELLAGASDAELARLRAAKVPAKTAKSTGKPASKVVVDDSQPAPKKKKPKSSTTPPAPTQ